MWVFFRRNVAPRDDTTVFLLVWMVVYECAYALVSNFFKEQTGTRLLYNIVKHRLYVWLSVRWRCGAHNKHLIWVTDLICDVCGELSSAQFYKQPCYAVLPPVRCVVWVAVSGWGVGKWRVLRTAISDKRGDLGCWHQPLRYWLGNVPHRRLFMCFFCPKRA